MPDLTESRVVHIVNKQGWHARPAALIVKTASPFKAELCITVNGESASAKSIMEVIMLASPAGTEVHLKATGPDAKDCVDAVAKLIESGFGEEIA